MDDILFSRVKKNYLINLKKVKGFSNYLPKSNLTNKSFRNKDLLNAATRVQTPSPFYHYIRSIEQALSIKFPTDLSFTKEEVIQSDLDAIKRFSVNEFDKKFNLNVDLLVKSSIQSALDLGILRPGIPYDKVSILDSMNSFEGNTSAGFPHFRKKNTQIARGDAFTWTKNYLRKPEVNNLLSQPTAVFHRYQYKVGGDLDSIVKKVRQVWGVPFRVLTLSGIFFRNMVEGASSHCLNSFFPAASWGRTKLQVSEDIIVPLRRFNKRIVSLDVDKFDASVPYFMWCMFYAIAKECINLDGPFDDKILDQLMYYDIFTPYCHSSDNLKFQLKGVPSGSLITSLFDTFVSRTVMNYSCFEYTNGVHSSENTCCVLGDDNVFAEVYTSYRHALSTYGRFGFTVSVDKSGVYEWNAPFRFLGYAWDSENRPTESLSWYVAHLCMPSRFFKSDVIPNDVLQTYRGLSICMGLYKGIETFEKLVGWNDYVWKDLLRQLSENKYPSIRYVGEDQRMMELTIPLEDIFAFGWTLF